METEKEIVKFSDNEIKVINTRKEEEVISIEQLVKNNEYIDEKMIALQAEKQENLNLIATAQSLGVSPLSE